MSDRYVADRIALQDVMLRYAAGVDERDFALYAGCFAEEVEVVGFGPQPFRGREEWVAYVRMALEQYGATQHMLGPQLAAAFSTASAWSRSGRPIRSSRHSTAPIRPMTS